MNKVLHVFTDPISYKEFISPNKNHIYAANHAGVYIWGFKKFIGEDSQEDYLSDAGFVPYYVGKHESSVFQRIRSHYNEIHHANLKDVFKEEFYKELPVNLNKFPKCANTTICLKAKRDPKNDDEKKLRDLHLFQNKIERLMDIYSGNKNFQKFAKGSSLFSQDVDSLNGNKAIQKIIDRQFAEDNVYISYACPIKVKARSNKNYSQFDQSYDSNKKIRGRQNREAENMTKWKLWENGYPTISRSNSPVDINLCGSIDLTSLNIR